MITSYNPINYRLKSLFIPSLAILIVFTFLYPVQAAVNRLSDKTIKDAVEDELAYDVRIPIHLIDVTVDMGIVTLSGKAQSVLAKERAARIARTVKGVRSVINEIRVIPAVLRSDREIRNDVDDALLINPATESFEIDVQVDNSIVTLSGTVDSWQERMLSEKVTKGVRGVVQVVNNIKVEYKEKRLDSAIRADVEAALKWDTLIDHALIDVAVEEGEVFLTGTVGSASEKQYAIVDAYVSGVESVDADGLKVKYWARNENLKKNKYTGKTDPEIQEAVKDALLLDPRVSSYKITPEVSKGIVTLRGTVDNLTAKRVAAEDARNTVGVAFVENRIRVKAAMALSDRKLEKQTRNTLSRNPFLEPYEIAVDVTNGLATLYGKVDYYHEKVEAENAVSNVTGIINVDNDIKVSYANKPLYFDPYLEDPHPFDYDWYSPLPSYSVISDYRIKQNIEDELWWSPFVDSDEVEVAVEKGVATLTGTVDSWSEYGAAADNAYEGGATHVDNELVVRP